MISLRHYQERAVTKAREAFREGHKAPLLVAPTGAGKTVMFSSISASASGRGNRIMITAHRFELLDQISKSLDRFDVEHGLICPGITPNPRARVQVASVPALARRIRKKRFETDLLVIDEAHHVQPGNSWGQIYEGLGSPPLLGVTASPIRIGGRGLGISVGGLFDHMINVISVQELIDEAFLVQPVTYAPAERLDLSGLKTQSGDFDQTQLAERVDKPKITGDAVSHYQQLCPGVPAVAFGVNIEHCQHIAEEFRAAGYRFEVVDGSMDAGLRKKLIRGLGREITGLVSCQLIGEGVDIPAIGCAILLRPTQSLGLHIQQMGRALRPIYADGFDLSTVVGRKLALAAAGKSKAFILDHAGNSLLHGLAETPHEWTLEGITRARKKAKAAPSLAVKQCEMCFAVYPSNPICPYCGHEHVSAREIEAVEGQLQEITPEMAKAISARKKREVQIARTLEQLQAIGRERGYSDEWASHVWASRERSAQKRLESQFAAFGR